MDAAFEFIEKLGIPYYGASTNPDFDVLARASAQAKIAIDATRASD
jgi:xylose isomerase